MVISTFRQILLQDRIKNDGFGGVCSMHVRYNKYDIYNGKPKGKDICDQV